MVRRTQDFVVMLDANGIISRFSLSAERETGYPSDHFLGKHWSEVLKILQVDCGCEPLHALLKRILSQEESLSKEVIIRTKSGEARRVLTILTPLHSLVRETPAIMAVGHDITAKAQRDEHVSRAGRLSALWSLCTVVSHELRNPLSAILLNAQMLAQVIQEDSPLWIHVRDILTGARRTEAYLDRLCTLARPALPQKTAFHLFDLGQEVVEGICTRAKESGIGVHTQCERDIPQAFGDPAQIQQVLLQLFANALEAMSQNGDLTFRCNRVATDGEEDEQRYWIEVHVEDTGCGIPEEDLKKVFDPFFTTKPGRHGLGLTLVHSLVEQNHGKIQLESKPGKGTHFTLRIPSFPAGSARS
jgi:PAS domain S-box-containing protein